MNTENLVGSSPRAPQEYTTAVGDMAMAADEVIALWRTGLTQGGIHQGKFDWYYRNNPGGRPLTIFLHHSGTREAVGVAAIGPRRIRFGDATLAGGALVDFVIRPDHRTFFPAMFLQRETRRRGLGEYAILFGFPNAKAMPIVRRIGYRCVGQFVRRIRVLRASTYLARYLPQGLSRVVGGVVDGCRLAALILRGLTLRGFSSRWQDSPDNGFDDLWRRLAPAEVVMGVRDMAFLAWRFVNVPSKTFKFFMLTSSTSQQLFAYAVCEVQGSVLHVQDFLTDPTVAAANTALWSNLSREAIRLGYTSLSIEFLGSDEQQEQLEGAGLRVRGTRSVFASLAPPPAGNITWPSNAALWYLTAADDDW